MASTSDHNMNENSAINVLIVVDTTGSMDPYLRALERLLPQIIALRTLAKSGMTPRSNAKYLDKISVLSYSDYYLPPQMNSSTPLTSVQNPIPPNDEADRAMRPKLSVESVIGWSGWDDGKDMVGGRKLVEWVKALTAEGGGDYPEAAKTALRRVLDLISGDGDRETLVLWYTDAPPHHRSHRSLNRLLEIAAHDPNQSNIAAVDSLVTAKKLNIATPLPPSVPIPKCIDWMALCAATRGPSAMSTEADFAESKQGRNTMKIWTILPPTLPDSDISFWTCLGSMSGGGTCVIGGPNTKLEDSEDEAGGSDEDMEATEEGSGYRGGRGGRVRVAHLSRGASVRGAGRNERKRGSKVQPEGENLMITTGSNEFVKRIVETSRAVLMSAMGLGSSELAEDQAKAKGQGGATVEGDGKEGKEISPAQKGADWLRLAYFRDDIPDYIPSGSQLSSARPTSSDNTKTFTTAEHENSDKSARVEKPTDPTGEDVPATATQDQDSHVPEDKKIPVLTEKAKVITDEDEGSLGFLPPPWKGPQVARAGEPLRSIIREALTVVNLQRRILDKGNAKADEVVDWSAEMKKSFESPDEGYAEAVIAVLKGVVEADVEAILSVSAFTEAWRLVTASSPSTGRDTLLSEYTTRVSKLRDKSDKDKAQLLEWARINYDASAEVRRLLEEDASSSMKIDSAMEKEKGVLVMEKDAISELGLSKEGILELARSVDKKVLKSTSDMLRYTRVISSTEAGESRAIDMTITSPQVLFRVIPHLAIEGLLYSPRAATILAVIAVISPISHLSDPAQELLRSSKGSWLSSSTPDNFTLSFVQFMLSLPPSVQELALSEEERSVYEGMGRYIALENDLMDRKVDALVPWTPMKSRGVGDRKRLCVGCGIERSETMMVQVGSYQFKKQDAIGDDEAGEKMRCGMCVDSVKDPQLFKNKGVMESCWVECSERWCRAQYVIEDEEGLRIPPRCYYCRHRKPCPWIECTVCTNRIILPKSYRVPSIDTPTSFICPPCQFSRPIGSSIAPPTGQALYTGHKTIVHKLTTLRSILFANEYEVGWLGIKPFQEVFRGRSTFMIWELYGSTAFTPHPISSPSASPVAATAVVSRSSTPPTPTSATPSQGRDKGMKRRLQVNGKALLNPSEVKAELDSLANMTLKKSTERCGLSFEMIKKGEELVTSCGNEGCKMRVSQTAWNEWFRREGRRRLCPACWRDRVIS